VIADVASYAITGIGFIHALGRLFVRKGFTASLNTVMTQNWIRRRDQCRERNMSALTNLP
jgi:hypothetical protein